MPPADMTSRRLFTDVPSQLQWAVSYHMAGSSVRAEAPTGTATFLQEAVVASKSA